MPTYRVVYASYCTEIVEANNEQDAIDLANGQFSPTYEWCIEDVSIDDSFIQHKEIENA
jgi:hypothetical protein